MQQNTTYNPKVSIIIPFYQKEKGILKKSLISALSQNNVSNFEIIVIDDSSPIPAEEEYTDFNQDQISKIKTIKQKNQGPAGARNKGLDSISPDTKYIAFLDSDDEWTSEHLSNALTALEFGFDFYFSDLYQLDQSISGFNRAKRIQINDHPKIFADNDVLRHFTGDMQEQIVTGNIIGTPTVVYRYSHYPELRFREDLIRAGEDYIFWLSLMSKPNTRIAFSSAIETKCGKGVNIYSGTQFGTPEYLELVFYETKYRKIIENEFLFSKTAKQKIREKLIEQKINFLRGILHSVRHGKPLNHSLLISYIKLCPEFLLSIPNNLFNILKKK
jgi:succinoglycan biosynthesis protein ExoW